MGISPAARGYPRPRLGDVLDERGHPRPLARGIIDRLGDIPGPSGDAPPASWSLVPHTQPTRVCHITRSKPTQQHVKRCLCDTTRPSEGSCCAAVAAARAALVPGGEARTSEPHSEARRGVRRAESPSDHGVRRCMARPLRPSRRAAEARTARGATAAGGRRAGEPAAREGAWPRRAQARSRGQALWSLGAARGGASPREHTQTVVSRRRWPLRSAAEWTGREPMSSRPTAWCRAALEPRRSARTPSGRRPSQPPARGLNRTGSGPLARLRTARAAGCGGGRSAGLGRSARHAECGRCRLSIRLQVAGLQAGSVFILTAYQNVGCKTRVACTRTRSHPRRRP